MAYDDARAARSPGTCSARASSGPPTCWSAANELVPLIRDRRPQVLITYNEIGGYGHPDHIQAHRVAMYANQLAGVPSYRRDLGRPWTVSACSGSR